MAPPLARGRALLRRRVAGVVFIAVIGLLVQTSVWLYQKKFTDVTEVALQTDRIGNQLSRHADVKVRGLVVGEVREIHSKGGGATLDLALEPEKAKRIPANVEAMLLPKTLFGEKQVVLVLPDAPSRERLRSGDVISQDRSATALETETALNDLFPRLQALDPVQLSTALSNLSTALRGRGDRLGNNWVQAAAYLRQINPEVPEIGADLEGLADLADTLSAAAPDLLRTLDNLAFESRSLVNDRAALDTWLRSTRAFAKTAQEVVADNEKRFVALAADSRAPLKLYASRSNQFACLINRINFSQIEGEKVLSARGLHITVEATEDRGSYVAGDEPKYRESRNFGCFGLTPKPIIPFPEYANAQDGYRDSAPPADPGEGPGGCCQVAWAPAVAPAAASGPASRSAAMPAATTELRALLLGPLGAA